MNAALEICSIRTVIRTSDKQLPMHPLHLLPTSAVHPDAEIVRVSISGFVMFDLIYDPDRRRFQVSRSLICSW